ncbi:hypothetical protein OSB04_010740 [Centaurea solstitialis]|uniref:Leucine-rich repeat-containing N-terminal plant-type domain-containing protein n=1 Tax=Centaurea solstitialis TaxID=347529 RepID=A0AA38TLB9_9ASTR|nr:hypothetical protein OSB04_010740 [Centaurea solstitialis]
MAAITTTQLSILSILFFILTFIPIPSSSCPLHQKQSLLQFKSTLTTIFHSNSDPTSVDYIPFVELDSWNRSSDCCSWARVKCGQTRNVTELHLDNAVPLFVDPVPEMNSDVLTPLFEIRSLKVLNISMNLLLGEIPGDGFGNLTELVHLDMMQNSFNGSIPGQIFRLPNLRYLDMSNNLLEGELTPKVGSFQNLTTLRLSWNGFHGPIPTQLFELKSLQVLDLSDNALQGVLAPEIGKLQNLESLKLKENFLSGSIPEEIGNLTRLREFSLANSKFSGGIPSSIVHLNELRSLDLSKNSFSMQIPAGIGKLSNLKMLHLNNNHLTGPIPSSMRKMTKLESLWLSGNTLAGEIPTWLFEIKTLKELLIGGKENNLIWNNEAKIVPRCRLQRISMMTCRISGHIPEWISSLKNLDFLDLSDNQLAGKLPDWLAKMDLESVILSDNNLTGSLSSRLFQSRNLQYLELSRNNFFGELPENIGNASEIMVFMLSGNRFSGQIPMSIKNIYQLRVLDFSKNKFSGEVPDFGENPLLAYINLSYNELSGMMPTTFSTVTRMIFLGGNKFYGDFPRNLTNLVNLAHLDLNENDITGNFEDILPRIPSGLQVLCLRNNYIEGFIPRTISNLTSLRILDLSGNNLTGSIPQEIGSLTRMIETPDPRSPTNIFSSLIEFPALILKWKSSFQGLSIHNLNAYSFLDLSNNKISSEIPASLGNLKYLKQLNLSHNNISGLIPKSFGNMKSMETLDLSHNEISGLIPESLTKLDELTYLDVSNNRLTGKIPVGGQMITMNELKFYANNNGLCGMQIRIKCPKYISPSEQPREMEDDNDSWISWEGTLIGFPIGPPITKSKPTNAIQLVGHPTTTIHFSGFSKTLPKLQFLYKSPPPFSTKSFKNKSPENTMAAITTTQLSILSIFFILITCIPIPSSSCPLHHKQSLLRFKSTLTTIFNSNSDPASIDYIPFAELGSWNHGSDCCSWARVKCGRTRNVTELHLDNTMPRLIDLVPADVLTPLFEIRSLKVLDVSWNLLQGEIPGDGFGNLTELVYLDLNENNFNGSIPGLIFRLPNLRYLDLSDNRLEGELTPELGSFQNLTTLRLTWNRFHGPILKEIGNLTRLREFSLASNKLSGGIPSSIVHLNELRSLYLWGNSFSMQIPADIGKLSNIKTLDLSYNRLTGPIPSSMRNMTKLESLWLKGNTLAREIPTWLFEIKTLKKLLIGGKGNNLIWNNEAKIVPRCRLQRISMRSCRISSHIPEWIPLQKNLEFLDLRDNHLTGKFPDWLAEMDIGYVLLSDNNLTGSLPSSLFQSRSLRDLEL